MPRSIWWVYSTLFVTFIADCFCATKGVTLPPIFWNSTSSIFKTSNVRRVIEVNMFDSVDFVCPFYVEENRHLKNSTYEYYIIHEVTKEEYENCILRHHSKRPKMVVNCSSPNERKLFTIWIEPFSPIPDVVEFRYYDLKYFITTSIGDKQGIANTASGACHKKNMKLIIEVLGPPSTTTTTQLPSTTRVETTTKTPTTTTKTITTSSSPPVHWTTRPTESTTTTAAVPTTTTIKIKDKYKNRENESEKDKLVSGGNRRHLSVLLLSCTLSISLLRGLLLR